MTIDKGMRAADVVDPVRGAIDYPDSVIGLMEASGGGAARRQRERWRAWHTVMGKLTLFGRMLSIVHDSQPTRTRC